MAQINIDDVPKLNVAKEKTRRELLELISSGNGSSYVAALAKELKIDYKICAFHIKKLENAGLIQGTFRMRDLEQKRMAVKYYNITKKGQEILSANVTDYKEMGTHTRAKEEIEEIQVKNQEIEELKKELTTMNALLEKLVSRFEEQNKWLKYFKDGFFDYVRKYGHPLTDENRKALEKLERSVNAMPDSPSNDDEYNENL